MNSIMQTAYRVCYLQIIAICSASFFGLIFYGATISVSLLCGGIAWLLPSFYFARKITKTAFPPKPHQTARSLAMVFFGGEFKKLAFSAVLVILFIYFLPLKIGAFICGYLLAVSSIWFYMWFFKD